MHMKTGLSSQCDRVSSFISCSVQGLFKMIHLIFLVHSFWTASFNEHMHVTFVIAQQWHHSFCPSNVERQREVVGLWVVPLRSLHCLNTVLHQLMDSIFVDHEGWTKLSSLHQLFETLKVENDTFRTDYFRWTAGTEQTLEFPFHTVGLASLPLPHRTPVVRSHI